MTVFNDSHIGRRVVEHSTKTEGVVAKFDNGEVLSVYVEFDGGTKTWFTNKGEFLPYSGVMAISLIEKGDEA